MTRWQAGEALPMAHTQRLALGKALLFQCSTAGHLSAQIHHGGGQWGALLPVADVGRLQHTRARPAARHAGRYLWRQVPIPLTDVTRPPVHIDVVIGLELVERGPGRHGQTGLDHHAGGDVGHHGGRRADQGGRVDCRYSNICQRRLDMPLQQGGQHQPGGAGERGRQASALQHGHISHHQERVQLQGGGGLAGLAQLQPGVCSGHADLVAHGERLGFGEGGGVDAHHGALI
ncbi:hypothetical protein D3C76_993620 [compost metagenome]